MAITVRGNAIHIPDSTSATSVGLSSNKSILVVYIIVTPIGASARLQLKDDDSGGAKDVVDIRWSNNDETKQYSFESSPIVFPNGIQATTTNCIATVIYKRL